MSTSLAELSAEQLNAQTLEWLRENLPAGWVEAIDAGDAQTVALLRAGLDLDAWYLVMGEAGYTTPTWPAEYGAGLSLTPGQARAVNDVLSRYQVPRSFNILGIGMGGPTVLQWGTEEMKHKYLRKIATNEQIWCQMFSEPGAGSDVAGLATRADRDGEEWIVNGQKVWTTLAHIAKIGMLVARSNPDLPKHKGLSYFLVDMEAPGVEVRPLVQITGDAEFNEVFFTDVRIPDADRVGPVGEGWAVALTTLMNERIALSGAGSIGGEVSGGGAVGQLIARHRPVADPLMRQRLARSYISNQIIGWNNQRAAARRRSGGEAGPEGSITKLQQALHNQELQKLAVDLEGTEGMAWDGPSLTAGRRVDRVAAVDTSAAGTVRGFLRSQANTIEGGTSNIMRNILGERVLGLPKEPDTSRELPWRDVPRNA